MIWVPHILLLAICAFATFAFDHILNTRPLDDRIAYQTLQRHLHQPNMVGNHILDLSPVKMIHRVGEAIVVGKGATQYLGHGADVPVLESINFEYIVVISRQCHNSETKCYSAQEVELTGEKISFPLI